jgi:hypothetical protein
MPAAFIGKPGLGRLQPVQDVIRRPLKPGPDMPGQLLGDTRHLGGMGLDLMPDADGGNLLPALLQLPRARRQLGQGRAVQRDGPDGVFQRLGLVALLLGDVGQLQRLDALRLKGAVVDPLGVAGQLQGKVGILRPCLAPPLQNLDGVPVAVLGGEALGGDLAGGQQDMGVVVAVIAFAPWRMKGDVGHHAPVHELALAEVAHQLDALPVVQLGGQGHPDFAGHLRILPGLGRLDRVPQRRPVLRPFRRMGRGEDFDVIDAAPGAIIERKPGAVILDVGRAAIGRRRRGAAASGSRNHRGPKVVDRHFRAVP